MARNLNKTSIGFSVLLVLLTIQSLFAQLGVQVNIAPPYPVRVSDFTAAESGIFITVSNPTSQTYNIFLSGSLRNEDNGMTVSTDPNVAPGACIEILPGGRTFSGSELAELFDPTRLNIRGTTLSVIRGDQALPEGRYTLCLRAESCEQRGRFYSPIAGDGNGCSSFDISFVEPPVISAPECASQIDFPAGNIPMQWTFIPPAAGMGTILFKLEMIELDPDTRNPVEAMGSTTPIFTKEDIEITTYNLLVGDDIALEEGKTYAFRVTSYDKDGKVQFQNQGKSDVCTFRYGDLPASTSTPRVTAQYPMNGDRLPFSFFPLVVKFDPYDVAYNLFVSDLTISNRVGAFDNISHDPHWPHGPLIDQRTATGFADLTEEQSQYLPIYKTNSESHPTFERGVEYTWNTDVRMERSYHPIAVPSITSTFSVGMNPSVLNLPANRDTVAAGSIRFQWKTCDPPAKILPDFNIVYATRASDGPVFFNGGVDERWVLEISVTSTFETIMHSIDGRLGVTIDLHSTPEEVNNALYKNLEESYSITTPGRYYWRVKWMSNPGNAMDVNSYATSEVFSFVITASGGTAAPAAPVAAADTVGGCRSVCNAPAITDHTASTGLVHGDRLQIGKFTLVVDMLTTTSGPPYSGRGYVQMPFLNNVKISVEFENIEFNAAKQIFSGTVNAAQDRAFTTTTVGTRVGDVITMAGEDAAALDDYLNDGERLLSFLTASREIGMPIGIDREIDGNKYTIGIMGIQFTPVHATLNAVLNLSFPQIGNELLNFGVKDLCVTPNGLGDEGRMYLASDWDLYQNGDTKFTFKGAATADTTASSYVSWDCHGFLCARIQGQVTFPRTMLVPDQADGTAGAGTVKGNFAFKTCRGNNFMAMITMDPFQIKGVDGWGWQATDAWLDFSDLENPPHFELPANYGDTTLLHGGARMLNTWQGFYMKNIEVKAPVEFENSSASASANRLSIAVANTIIDGTGLTTSIRGNHILGLEQGSFKGWGISLDTVRIDFVSNVFREGGISGKLGLPIFATGQSLDYHMALTYGDEKLNYLCRVFARDTLTVPMWAAKMHLRPDSEIRLQVGDSTYASTNLSGDIGISGDLVSGTSSIPGLNFAGIRFEGFKLSTSTPHFDVDSVYFSHSSPQKQVAGFPVNVHNISLNLTEISRPGINFDLDIVLGDFSAGFGFGVFGRLNYDAGRFSAGFDGIDMNSIRIDQTISGVKMLGELDFFRHDALYGNGIKGYIDVTLPMKVQAKLTAQFGTVKTSPTAVFGTPDNYSYWFVDGLVNFPGGAPIFAGFGIYGFGGGAYYHMRMDTLSLPAAASTTGGSTPRGESIRTSARYIPDFRTYLGMNLTAVLGTQPSSETFNMDASISAEFNSSGGLNFIGISAKGFIMAAITDRPSAKVKADVSFRYSIPADGNANLHGDFNVYVNVYDKLKGGGINDKFVNATFHVEHDLWYFYLGTLTNRADLLLHLPPVLDARLTSYLMIGHGIPPTIPPPPDKLQTLLYGGGTGTSLGTEGAMQTQLSSQTRGDLDQSKYTSGTGFAFGVFFDYHSEMDFAIFYASLDLLLGFDLNITKDNNRVCAETGTAPGLNNWYAQGQIYAGLWGEMGVKVDLWFISGRFPFVNLAAGVLLQGGMPHPDWFSGRAALAYSVLDGLVEGRCSFEVNVGQRCSIVSADPFSGVQFISDVRPQEEDSPVSVFEQPRVSFNLPVEQMMIIPVPTQADPTLTRQFRPFIASYKLIRNDGSNFEVPGRFEMSERNTISTFKFIEALESTSQYKIVIVVQSDEYHHTGPATRVMIDGVPWEERREVTFTTRERPITIVPENVVYTYPIENQRFFLKGEVMQGTRGLVKLIAGQSYLFDTMIGGVQYTYIARFKSIPGGDPFDVPLLTHGLFVDFVIPVLDNDKLYSVQIIRKPVRTMAGSILAGLGSTAHPAAAAGLSRTAAVALTPLRFDLELSSANIRREGQLLPGSTVDPGEFLLYNFYFKTSKYNTVQEKFASSVLLAEYKNLLVAELFDIKTVIPELFDEFDIHGFYKNGAQVLKPLLAVEAPFEYSYHYTKVNPFIYSLIPRLQTFMSTAPAVVGVPQVTTLNGHGKGNPPVQTVDFGTGRIEPPLSVAEITSAAGLSSSTTLVSTAIPVSNPALASILGGATTSLAPAGSFSVSSISAALPVDPSNFRLYYETSNFVMQDFTAMKGNVSRILSSTLLGVPIYRNALTVGDPALLDQCNQLLRKSAADFMLSPSEYGIRMYYRIPTSVGNENSSGLKSTKTFWYGVAPVVVPSLGIRPRLL